MVSPKTLAKYKDAHRAIKFVEFDFTKLDNYVPPERTLETPETKWINRKSTFYQIPGFTGDIHVEPFEERNWLTNPRACRVKDTDLEFELVSWENDTLYDAIHGFHASIKHSDFSLVTYREWKVLRPLLPLTFIHIFGTVVSPEIGVILDNKFRAISV